MRVFITGAAGYIGEEVALAYRRNGHDVYGLVRSASAPAAKNLAIHEVQLVVGDLTKPETYQDVAATADVIIHTAIDWTQPDVVETVAVKTLLAAASKKGKKKVTFIFTSGCLAYPSSKALQSEDDPVDPNPHPMIALRLADEQRILSNDIVHGVVIRPCAVYGGRSVHFGGYFKQIESGDVTVEGPELMLSQVHVHDVADAYLRIGEAAPSVVGGQIFNVADDSRNTRLAVVKRFAEVAGFKGEIKTKEASNPLFSKNVIVDYRKATRLLGWVPKHKNLVDDAEILYKSWKAAQ